MPLCGTNPPSDASAAYFGESVGGPGIGDGAGLDGAHGWENLPHTVPNSAVASPTESPAASHRLGGQEEEEATAPRAPPALSDDERTTPQESGCASDEGKAHPTEDGVIGTSPPPAVDSNGTTHSDGPPTTSSKRPPSRTRRPSLGYGIVASPAVGAHKGRSQSNAAAPNKPRR
jgi:hypothetical protein